MGNIRKKLGEAELEIMQVVWDSERPVTSNYILKELQGRRKWQLSTLMTSLSRLARDLSIVIVQPEAICTIRLFQKMSIKLERASTFSKNCTIVPYKI